MTDSTLLILSDSHGHPACVEEALRRVRPDGILFAGDGLRDLARIGLDRDGRGGLPCPLWAVRGNCDWMCAPLVVDGRSVDAPEEELLMWEGLRILLCHGHRYGVKSGLSVAIAHAASRGADILVFGHTHEPLERRIAPGEMHGGVAVEKPLLVFNPGSIGDGRFGTLTVRRGVPLLGHGSL